MTTIIEHTRNRVEGGGGRVFSQFYGIVETLEENKATQ